MIEGVEVNVYRLRGFVGWQVSEVEIAIEVGAGRVMIGPVLDGVKRAVGIIRGLVVRLDGSSLIVMSERGFSGEKRVPPGVIVREVQMVSVVPGVAVIRFTSEGPGVRYGVGS